MLEMSSGERGKDPPTRLTEPAVDADRSRSGARWGTTLSTRGEERDHALVRRFTLLVTAGADAGQKIVSAGDRMVVGTHNACDVVLHDATVSRFHCEIAVAGKSIVVRDLESSNGTLVDGIAILHAYLRGGAVLTLGRTQLRFDSGGEPVKVPLSTEEQFGELVGSGAVMRRVFALLERAAASDVAVLLEGEVGTGKSSAARSLHAASARRDGPFVVVDCATASRSLLEAELFGSEGGFTAAAGGTLYLREVAEIPSELHPRLAATLETRTLLFGEIARPIDVRVVAGTRRNLKTEVNARRFRSDLYHRLAVAECRLPPLREHPEDLPMLIEEALIRAGAAPRPEVERWRNRDFYAELGRHAWPGNVRELFELVERAVDLRADGPSGATEELPLSAARAAWVADFERRYLGGLLASHHGDAVAAARSAGVDGVRFGRLLDRYRLR